MFHSGKFGSVHTFQGTENVGLLLKEGVLVTRNAGLFQKLTSDTDVERPAFACPKFDSNIAPGPSLVV